MRTRYTLFLILLVMSITGCREKVESPRPFRQYSIAQFMATTKIGGGAISPDEEKVLLGSNASGIFNLYTVATKGGDAQMLTHSTTDGLFAISFFPADDRILYYSDKGGNEINHLYVLSKDGSTKDLTPDTSARASFYGWSQDEQSLYYSSNKRNPRYEDLFEMDVATFTPRMVLANDSAFETGAISPDRRHLALTKNITTNRNEVYLYDIDTKKYKRILHSKENDSYSPQYFSRDGKKLFYTTNEGREFMALYSYDVATGATHHAFSESWDIDYAYLSPKGKYTVLGVNQDASTVIKIYETETGTPVTLPKLPTGEIQKVQFSRTENLLTFYANTSRSPSNLYVLDLRTGGYKQITNTLNPEIDREHLVTGQVVRYKSFDGLSIPALLYKPQQLRPGEKAPALLWIHGGPGGQTTLTYSPLMQYLANHGYVILAVNNRGSSGYGKTFYGKDDRRHGQDDLMDCVQAKQFLAKTGYVDVNKIGIMGGSYGGYMVLAGLAFQPEAFAVGVDLFGVSNWLRTLKSIPPWWESFRRALYEEVGDPVKDEAMLRAKSPLFHADKIRRPLLVLQGANDPRVLQVESDEIVEAVKKNNVPVEYIIFKDEGHGFKKRENEVRGYGQVLQFLDTYLKSVAPTAPVK